MQIQVLLFVAKMPVFMACLKVRLWLPGTLFGQWTTRSRKKGSLLILPPSTATTPASSLTQFVESHSLCLTAWQTTGTTRSGVNFWMATWETIAHFTPALLWLLKWQCSGYRCMAMKMGTSSQMLRRSYFHQAWQNPLYMTNMQRSGRDRGMLCRGQPFSSTWQHIIISKVFTFIIAIIKQQQIKRKNHDTFTIILWQLCLIC